MSPYRLCARWAARAVLIAGAAVGTALAMDSAAHADTLPDLGSIVEPLPVVGDTVADVVEPVQVPDVDLPGVNLPGVDLPGVELPGVELPEVELPEVELPAPSVPSPVEPLPPATPSTPVPVETPPAAEAPAPRPAPKVAKPAAPPATKPAAKPAVLTPAAKPAAVPAVVPAAKPPPAGERPAPLDQLTAPMPTAPVDDVPRPDQATPTQLRTGASDTHDQHGTSPPANVPDAAAVHHGPGGDFVRTSAFPDAPQRPG